jgi:DNA topoisomerase-1
MLNHPAQPVKARLTHYNGEKLEKFSIPNEAHASSITESLKTKTYNVTKIDPKQSRRNPYAPFTTSTLQQEAARKLGFGAKRTMQIAQKLYEGIDLGGETTGLITYMRTDGVYVAQEAIQATRALIGSSFGNNYLPESPKYYKAKTTNAQEAHEAIRPTDVARTPKELERFLDTDMLRLYELIWKRMVASQMESAVFDVVSVDFVANDNSATLRANGSVMKFDGFLKLYQEGRDDEEDEEDESRILPPMKEGESYSPKEVLPEQHFTEPPPRYSEASLVKKLEELGIGRPSTYASIISVLQDREYVRLDKKRFIAEPRGRIVNAFLVSFFRRYVEYDFTAQLEERLDEISEGKIEWKEVLRDWWSQFIATVNDTKELTNQKVLESIDVLLEPFIFRGTAAGVDPRVCPSCGKGRLGLKTGKFGAFLGCSSYPECGYTKQLTTDNDNAAQDSTTITGDKELGVDPATGMNVILKKGPYGWYVQLGMDKKPKRASVNKSINPDTVTLEMALSMLALPREVGNHPESGKPIVAGVGRFGPYLLHDGKYTSLKGDDDVLTIGINRAVDVLAAAAQRGAGRAGASALRTLGNHPDEGSAIAIYSGKYGPYIKFGKLNITLPKSADVDTFSLDEAVTLITEKGGTSKKKPSAKKAPAKKAAKKEDAEVSEAKTKPKRKKAAG